MVINLSAVETKYSIPDGKIVISNYDKCSDKLRAYECTIYKIEKTFT